MSFFLKKKPPTPRRPTKRKDGQRSTSGSLPKRKAVEDEISSDSEVEIDEAEVAKELRDIEETEQFEETAQERKLRLAKKYLEDIEREEKERLETQEVDQSILSNRLRRDLLDQEGKLVKQIADDYIPIETTDDFVYLKNAHRLSVTCAAISPTFKYIISGGKDGRLVKWEFPSGKKLIVRREFNKKTDKDKEDAPEGHASGVNSLTISSDGKFLASSDSDTLVFVWNPEDLTLLHKFQGHRGPVSGVVFRRSTHTLYSCSHDRSVKVWDVNELSYVETLFGHQESITAVDSLIRERALTAGGRDATLRVWKIPEESQLVYQGNAGHSIDCAKFLDEQHFVSGGEEGSISFWSTLRKKPLTVIKNAHGKDKMSDLPNWISCVGCLQNTDMFATGSCDGQIRVWKSSQDSKKVQEIFSIPVKGFVNCLEFSPNGDFLVAGIGQEHRLGRWWKIREARNQLVIIPLKKK